MANNLGFPTPFAIGNHLRCNLYEILDFRYRSQLYCGRSYIGA
jgi:hypothetical protein